MQPALEQELKLVLLLIQHEEDGWKDIFIRLSPALPRSLLVIAEIKYGLFE